MNRLSAFNFYFSNLYFADLSDKSNMSYGVNFAIKLPLKLSINFDLSQSFYDSELIDNDLDQMTNFGISMKYNF